MTHDLTAFLQDLDREIREKNDWGEPANYIPELARINPAQFGISVALADGTVHSAGNADVGFSIQSISKIFSLACVLGRIGEQIWIRVGREPSGARFDSILLLEREQGRPRNPFINAGALVVTDELLAGRTPSDAVTEILSFVRAAAEDDNIYYDKEVAESEIATGFRNAALVNYLKSFGNLRNSPEATLYTYIRHCAIEMNCRQLALAGRSISGLPGAPSIISPIKAKRLNALMMLCGHYDGSGDFAFRVGLPGKSGVGGGLLLIAPDQASVAIWSPGLNAYGNSKQATYAAERLAQEMGWSVFG